MGIRLSIVTSVTDSDGNRDAIAFGITVPDSDDDGVIDGRDASDVPTSPRLPVWLLYEAIQ